MSDEHTPTPPAQPPAPQVPSIGPQMLQGPLTDSLVTLVELAGDGHPWAQGVLLAMGVRPTEPAEASRSLAPPTGVSDA